MRSILIAPNRRYRKKVKKMTTLSIIGYEQTAVCGHCNRKLKHGIKITSGTAGDIVGATCFAKVLTKPLMYQGKPYRLDAENIIAKAKAMEFWTPQRRAIGGFHPHSMNFEAA